MGFGAVDGRDVQRLFSQALAAGVVFIDSAGFYAQGESEARLAKAIRGQRARLFLSCKGGLEWHGRHVRHNGSPEALRRALQGSLRRLNTDYLDLFQLHWPDPDTPLAESLECLQEMQRQGWIRHWGIGNWSARQISDLIPPEARIAHQVHHNPLVRADEVLEAGVSEGRCLNCITSPWEQGLLANDRHLRGVDGLGKRDVRRRNPHFQQPQLLAQAREIHAQAAREGTSPLAWTLAWLRSDPRINAIVCGPKTSQQWRTLEPVLHRLGQGGSEFSPQPGGG